MLNTASRTAPSLTLALSLLLVLGACGGDEPGSAGAGPKARAQAAIRALIVAAKAKDSRAAAGRVVYRGDDKARRWKSLVDPSDADELRQVERLCKRIRKLMGGAEPTFVSFRSETESEGTWMVWKVQGETKSASFACLDIDGTVALGDIDAD
ncbi:MAG: hypothetical protein ACYTFT_18290 [Planctomycetota bacterium]|jgi:hypothetical protein